MLLKKGLPHAFGRFVNVISIKLRSCQHGFSKNGRKAFKKLNNFLLIDLN